MIIIIIKSHNLYIKQRIYIYLISTNTKRLLVANKRKIIDLRAYTLLNLIQNGVILFFYSIFSSSSI